MKGDTAVRRRNKLIHGVYRHLLKPAFFARDPETVHDRMTAAGARLGRHRLGRKITGSLFDYEHPALEQEILGIRFRNPVGLSAGFDKDARLTDILHSVGFGFVEVGSVTGKKCPGNPKPRLWRLPESRSLAVYYGLKNDGCEDISGRLSGKRFAIPVGVSVAMTNCSENLDLENALKDYEHAFRTMEPVGSYLTINISCPNAQGGQPFIRPENLEKLLARLDRIPTGKPVFLKLSPDLSEKDIDEMLAVAGAHRVAGLICANLTKKSGSNPYKGGLSGKAAEDPSNSLLASVCRKAGGRFVLIGSGGIFSAEDAYRKIRLGASLLQLITGMIYEGPQVISEINQGLVELLHKDGFKNITEAIGFDNK